MSIVRKSLISECFNQRRVQQALAADSPVSGFFSRLSGRAAEAQRWALLIMFLRPKRELTLLLGAVCLFALCGCDGGIHVKGHVYAEKNSNGNSRALVDQSGSPDANLSPVKGANVTLYHAGDYSKEKAERSELRSDSTLTASDGSFEVGGVTSPFRFNAGLIIEKGGYKPVTKVFLHDKIDHEAIVILVPESAK